MRIDVLTLFPEMFESLNHSIIGRAKKKQLIDINIHNIRDFTTDKHKNCDDYGFGGGAGMVMMAQPIFDAINYIDPNHNATRIFMSPCGQTLKTEKVVTLAKSEWIILLCGHYEGVDQRAIDLCIDDEISIGDYILTGGELPAMVVIDSVSRYVENVLGSSASLECESFNDGLLEYPHYTRPQIFQGLAVPDVLTSGNHGEIEKWRKAKSEEITNKKRPDLKK